MTTFGPPGHDDWPALAATAAQLRDRSPRDSAERRIFAGLAALWRAVVDRTDMPAISAYRTEIRPALAKALQRAREGGADRVHIARLAALAWYHEPAEGNPHWHSPLIVQVHKVNQLARAERAARPARVAPNPSPRPAPAFKQPALKQTGLF